MQYLTVKKQSFAIIISLFSITVIQAQEYQLLKTIELEANSISSDRFGNFYAYGAYKLVKFDIDGNKLNEFEDYRSGKISYIDATDPLKTLVYYEDFMVLKILDKTLSEIASLSLNDLGFYSINAVAQARDGNIWLFDNANFKLKKLSENGKILYESESFNMLFNAAVQPSQILDHERLIYLNDPKTGVYIFDRFGAYKERLHLLNAEQIQIIQTMILYYKEGNMNSFNTIYFETKSTELPGLSENIIDAQFQKDRLYVLEAGKIKLYKVL